MWIAKLLRDMPVKVVLFPIYKFLVNYYHLQPRRRIWILKIGARIFRYPYVSNQVTRRGAER